jgi:maltooligosyltrehalose trehalohydrolase
VELVLKPEEHAHRVVMEPEGRGYFAAVASRPPAGARYGFSLDGGPVRPDPASRWQPDGVDRPSAVVFPEEFSWDENGWRGIARPDLVLYELHVGAFTPEGTFDAIIPRVADLADLGVTAIELMPVAQFPGRWSWGYDGVHPLAVQNSYGGPDGLMRLVQACHRLGVAIVLDVVFNHLGPEGNVLPAFGDVYNERYHTDWGAALNYDGRRADPVRALVVQAARAWVRDFRVDGLRLDAADQIYDRGPRHILADIAAAVREAADLLGRPVHVFAETDLNDARRFLAPVDQGGYGLDGHWNDDFHHAVHATLTEESNGYYADFADGPVALAKVFREVFVNDGTYSPFRGRRHGAPATEYPGDRFVAFIQNHDQVGNRPRSDRYATSLPAPAVRLAAGLLLLAPRVPLLFMGEEYGETSPFPFFCDFQSPDLIEAVRAGRRAEFEHFGWAEDPPDPFAAKTRTSAMLSWSWSDPRRAALRRMYRDLLALRRTLPALRDFRHAPARLLGPGGRSEVLEVVRSAGSPFALTLRFNLSAEPRPLDLNCDATTPVFRSEDPAYGGSAGANDVQRPYEFVILASREV